LVYPRYRRRKVKEVEQVEIADNGAREPSEDNEVATPDIVDDEYLDYLEGQERRLGLPSMG